jgi:formiminotetrahydrofolate cyclodeaminase
MATSVEDWTLELATPDPTPGAGAAAAVGLAMGAGLVEMAAQWVDGSGWERSGAVAGEARRLRARALGLAGENEERYAAAIAVLSDRGDGLDEKRDEAIGVALADAAQTLGSLAEAAAEVAELAAEVSRDGAIAARPDMAAAAMLAEAAARSACVLTEVNIGLVPQDLGRDHVRELAARARAAREATLEAVEEAS